MAIRDVRTYAARVGQRLEGVAFLSHDWGPWTMMPILTLIETLTLIEMLKLIETLTPPIDTASP